MITNNNPIITEEKIQEQNKTHGTKTTDAFIAVGFFVLVLIGFSSVAVNSWVIFFRSFSSDT